MNLKKNKNRMTDKDNIIIARETISVYLGNIKNTTEKENKIDIMKLMFNYIAKGGSILIDNKHFIEIVRKKLFFFYFNECVEDAASWYKNIFGNEICQDKIYNPGLYA